MSVEPERTPQRRETQAQPQARRQSAPDSAPGDDHSELLRWRADQLLDEMMIGAVDVSAVDPDERTRNGHSTRHQSAPEPRRSDGVPVQDDHRSYYPSIPATGETGAPTSRFDEGYTAQWAQPGARWDDESAPRRTDAGDAPHAGYRSHSDAAADPGPTNGAAHDAPYGGATHSETRRAPDAGDGYAPSSLDIYFDAYETGSPRRQPATRPPLIPFDTPQQETGGRAAQTRSTEAGEVWGLRRESGVESGWREPFSQDAGDTGGPRTHDARPRPPGDDGASRNDTPSDSFIPSKINGADYLSRRYGYVEPESREPRPAEDDFDRRMDRALGEPPAHRAPGAKGPDNSRAYYERRRVDREERMRSAEHRPEHPLHRTDGEPDDRLPRGPRRDDLHRPDSRRPDRGAEERDPSQDLRISSIPPSRRSAYELDLELRQDLPKDEEAPQGDDHEWILRAKEKWNWQDVSGVSRQIVPEMSGGAESLYAFELAGYDRDPHAHGEYGDGRGAGAMAMAGGKKRSTLLPRLSSTSVQAQQDQLDELLAQIVVMLPEGHENRRRAQHLLDKAVAILQSDPMRSAEVEYYMQQVRGIVQRQEQANRLSNLYRERLQLYLGAWMAFSLIVLLARYLFQFEFDAFLAGTFQLDYSGALLQNAAPMLGSLFAGALGGSIGALLTLVRHARLPHGYVDRKYGLRGLILPLMGFLAGGIIYLPFGLFFYVIGLDPSLNMIAASIAAVSAFAFGFNQESFYGTRE